MSPGVFSSRMTGLDYIAAWDFTSCSPLVSTGRACRLVESGNALMERLPCGLRFHKGCWLEAADSAALQRPGVGVSVVSWLFRHRKADPECEFIAGVWDETGGRRQYGLFLNLSIHESCDQVCGHVSSTGGASPGSPWCLDAAIGSSPVTPDSWHGVGFTFDGRHAACFFDGDLDPRPGRNPWQANGPLAWSDAPFTVGAVHRGGEMGNWFCGVLAGLAVFPNALTKSQMVELTTIPR